MSHNEAIKVGTFELDAAELIRQNKHKLQRLGHRAAERFD